MKRSISIIILAYNTVKTIEKVVTDYYKIAREIPGSEVIVAEDGSSDGTREVLIRLSKKIPVRLILGQKRKGYGKAMKDAFERSKNDFIFFTDSDGEFYAEDFWKLPYCEDYDIVIGYRTRRKPAIRFLLSQVNNVFIGVLFGVWLRDSNCPFRIIKRGVMRRFIDRISTAMHPNFELMILAKKYGYRIKEVPVRHILRDSEFFSIHKIPKIVIKTIRYLIRLRRIL